MQNLVSPSGLMMSAPSTQSGAISDSHTTRTLAAIDIGTNSIHMVVVKVDTSLPAFTIINREKNTVRLGDRDPKTGNLTPEACRRAITALHQCKGVATSLKAEQILAVATSAVREAPNGRDFIRQVQEELDIWINLVSGQEEARRIYLGVLSGMEFAHRPHVVIDIGGGSTELILGDGREPAFLSSTKVGAVRLSHEFITTDPISDDEFCYVQAYVRGMLERPIDELQARSRQEQFSLSRTMIGTSGTIECVAGLIARELTGTVPDPLNGYQFSFKALGDLVNRLRRMTLAERAALPGMTDRRAEIILPGAIVLQEAMFLLDMEEVAVCERALREGIIVDWMLAHGLIEDHLRYQSSVRQRSVLLAAQKFQVNREHSDRVAQFAMSLFDQTQGVLHAWGDEERELLWAAAILHNCGHFISHSAHHKHSYYLIRNGDLLGYTETEIETIANLARYHRKSCPKKKHTNYRSLMSKRDRKLVDQLSPLLRLAVALDRRQIGAIAEVHCEFKPEVKELQLWLKPDRPTDDCMLELWGLGSKKDCFESLYNLKLVPILETE